MGKLIYFITFIIFMDLLFLTTGQLCTAGDCSLNSIIFNAMLNGVENFQFGTFFGEIIGNVLNLFNSKIGFTALLVALGVASATIISRVSESILFIPVGITLGLLSGDMIFIFTRLVELNFLLGIFIAFPMLLIYAVVVLDWIRGKD